jgi:Mg-chelatase subunit ChlD
LTSSSTPLAVEDASVMNQGTANTVAKIQTTLMVFVVDTSMPGGSKRIAAVKGTISTLLPKTKVAVISCFGDEAEMTLEPTSSFITACRKLMNLKGSVMGNLGAGLNLALRTSEDALKNSLADRVIMAVIADGKAHGLMTGTSDCEVELAEVCDLELMTSAVAIQIKAKELELSGMNLKSVIVDTEAGRIVNGAEWSEEGARLASVTGADYYHLPELMDTDLLRYVRRSLQHKLSKTSYSPFIVTCNKLQTS